MSAAACLCLSVRVCVTWSCGRCFEGESVGGTHLGGSCRVPVCGVALQPRYGQVVIGPPGSGKSTYCKGMKEFLEGLGR